MVMGSVISGNATPTMVNRRTLAVGEVNVE